MVSVLCNSLGDGYLSALDENPGREIWRTKRDAAPSWSTPALAANTLFVRTEHAV